MTARFYNISKINIDRIYEALRASRPYVECCTEPDKTDGASAALVKLDGALKATATLRER